MKELSIEEKAKRYDEGLKEAVIAHKDEDRHLKATLERIFPELAESEDERIRKDIISYLKSSTAVSPKTWIDWLEKQGEHARFIEAIQVGDKVTRNENGVLVNLSQLNRVAKKEEKQGECMVSAEAKETLLESKFVGWSEEYERYISYILTNCMHYAEEMGYVEEKNNSIIHQQAKEWLKFLKDRVLPQPKQEWSEEDEKMCAAVLQLITDSEKENCWNCVYCNDKEIYFSDIISWLKSLRPQKQWKPSEEQLIALRQVISGCSYDIEPLVEIEEQLKKLKKE